MSLHTTVCLTAALWASAAGVHAQQTPANNARPGATAPAGSAPTSGLGSYRSAFDGYRRYADEPVTPWKAANDQVGRIGGWRTYAKEASGEAGADPHQGHGSPAPAAGASAPDAARPPASGPTPPRAGTATTDKPFGQTQSPDAPKAAPRPAPASAPPATQPKSSPSAPAAPADHSKHH